MNMPISQSEQQALLEKRKQLFSLWRTQDHAPEPPATAAPRTQRPVEKAPMRGQTDEVREMIQKFVDPNTDRWALF